MIIQNRLNLRWLLPLLKSVLSYHMFLNGILHLKDRRFLKPVQQLRLKDGLERQNELLIPIGKYRGKLIVFDDPVTRYIVFFTIESLTLNSVDIHCILGEERGTVEVFIRKLYLLLRKK